MISKKGPILGARHVQTLLLFLSITIHFAERNNVSVSLVAMTDAKTTNPNFHEFDWNEKEKSYIVSSFFWGYTIFQIPGSYAARRVGVKTTLFIGTFLSSILGLLVPFCVFWGGWKLFCVIRVFQGLSQAALFPCIYQHLAKWAPGEELNRLGTLTYSGVECGTIVAMYFTGIIAASDLGWPGVSYVFNGIGIVFSLVWFILAENSPAEAKLITTAERNYILTSQASIEHGGQMKSNIPIPWKAMLTSGPLISLLVVVLGETWGFYTLLVQIPTYLHGILKMNITNNALYSALPFVTMWMFSYVFMIIAEIVMKNKWTSLLVLRKVFSTISTWGPGALLFGIGFLNENQRVLAITLIILSVGLIGGHTIGSSLNLIDLSPNHVGILLALVNTLASGVAVVCPIVAGIIIHDETDRSQWQIVFMIAAAFYILSNLHFLFYADTDVQPWNDENFMTKLDTEQGVPTSAEPSKESFR